MRWLQRPLKASVRGYGESKKSRAFESSSDEIVANSTQEQASQDQNEEAPDEQSNTCGPDLINAFTSDFRNRNNRNAQNWRETFLGKACTNGESKGSGILARMSSRQDQSADNKRLNKASKKGTKGAKERAKERKVKSPRTKDDAPGKPGPGKSRSSERKANARNVFSTHTSASFVTNILSSDIEYSRFEVPDQPPVPPLANNLDRVLFSPGVHFLKDPRSNVYNFPPSLENIMSIRDFDFDKVPQFVPSGKDNKLALLAQQQSKKYTGSTSSVTGILFHLHQALSHHRPPSLMGLSKYFGGRTTEFTNAQKMPAAFLLKYNKLTKTHAIAPLPSPKNSESILSLLGHAMETMLVTESAEFAKYNREKSHLLPSDSEFLSTYNYLSSGPFLLRSQLDCFDERLPGTGYFDLKTRACCAVRHDLDYAQIRDGCTYQIIKRDGFEESYAREFYELIRTALFKYSLQARIGSMDGIFVAYHNINTLFGFEYLPLEDIDSIFHTSHLVKGGHKLPNDIQEKTSRTGSLIAQKEFALSLGVLEKILDKIVATAPEKSLKVFIESPKARTLRLVCTECDDPEFVEADVEIGDEAIKVKAHHAQDFKTKDQPKRNHYGFIVLLTSTINGAEVTSYPHIENESDCWEVACDIEEIPRKNVAKVFKKMIDLYKPQVLQTMPKIDRDRGATQHDEEFAIQQLEVPTAFQERLRELQQRGKEYQERNEKREKVTWTPRT